MLASMVLFLTWMAWRMVGGPPDDLGGGACYVHSLRGCPWSMVAAILAASTVGRRLCLGRRRLLLGVCFACSREQGWEEVMAVGQWDILMPGAAAAPGTSSATPPLPNSQPAAPNMAHTHTCTSACRRGHAQPPEHINFWWGTQLCWR